MPLGMITESAVSSIKLKYLSDPQVLFPSFFLITYSLLGKLRPSFRKLTSGSGSPLFVIFKVWPSSIFILPVSVVG
jgi:hypothetical protein